ncbi:hypothetical protein CUMW_226610 [Citrus unshiu]|uniref:Uncharacterized protein n=1 Tax=Citrus unshiu TaxID=55188 RepID=A0A2H5QG21_CITUN|nr:hypothetical protein CUMW_226610 [Citrus unshiu]
MAVSFNINQHCQASSSSPSPFASFPPSFASPSFSSTSSPSSSSSPPSLSLSLKEMAVYYCGKSCLQMKPLTTLTSVESLVKEAKALYSKEC